MVEELLDFSRMESGRLNMQKEKMDILAELEEAVLIYEEKAKKENILLRYTGPGMLPVIFGDRARLRQVFINVIDNAIKYSDPGGEIRISAAVRGDSILVQVSDNGIGIAPEDLPRVKMRFYKGNYSRRGSGIGLAVVVEKTSAQWIKARISEFFDCCEIGTIQEGTPKVSFYHHIAW